MRKASRYALPAILFLALVAASCPRDRMAYTSINGATDGVQTAVKVWNEAYYTPGVKVDSVKWNASRDKIEAAYKKFQATAHIAVTLAKDITQRDNALKIVNDAAAQVIALIQLLEK